MRDERVQETRQDYGNEEVNALATAYHAIASQPPEAWDRMMTWLAARLRADQRPRAALSAEGQPR